MPRVAKDRYEEDSSTLQVVRPADRLSTLSIGFSETASDTGRSVRRHEVPIVTPRSPPKAHDQIAPQDGDAVMHSTDDDATVHHHDIGEIMGLRKKSRRNNYFVSEEHDAFLTEWLAERDSFLSELLRLEGLRGCETTCGLCAMTEVVYRCATCYGGTLLCSACCVKTHASLPFHAVKEWDGRRFSKVSLASLGLVVQLGHAPGERCPKPTQASSDFMVLDLNGWHKTKVQYCDCAKAQRAGAPIEQLLRYELYPATLSAPSTCFTFRLLEMYHALTLQSKTTVYDFYITLNNITDNTGVDINWDRLKQFLRVVREWRHLKALKRAGRGYDPNGVAATKPGELCIHCPACPRPGINLPRDWKNTPDELKYLYTLILAVDANFRLKRRAVSSNERDPALGSGWGYFVEDKEYLKHVLSHANQDDISTCTGFAAISQANNKFSKGYASTGVGMVICARHGMIRPNAVGDLQKGERYCNIDYIMCATLRHIVFTLLVISYDIACQWALRFLQRIANFPPHVSVTLPSAPGEIRYAIPKYHFRAHKEEGHTQYSLHYMKGVGRVCGEQIERTWPKHSETAGSTREMGPGSRHDTLEDHFGYTNWRVLVSLGSLLQRLHKQALTEDREQSAVFEEFRGRLEESNVKAWDAEVMAYELDPGSVPDPYFRVIEGMTEAEVRLELARKDSEAHAEGNISLHEVTPAGMIIEMLEIEDLKRKFLQKYSASARSGMLVQTTRQSIEMLSKRTVIRRRITLLRQFQAIYMPAVPALVAAYAKSIAPTADTPSAPRPTAAAATRVADRPEVEPLFLPSDLKEADLVTATAGLKSIEERLRDAQLHESLDRLRVLLHVKARLVSFKNRQVRHQGPNTRARRLIDINQDKIDAVSDKYRDARKAKLALAGSGSWESIWCPLQPSDVRTMLAEDDPVNIQPGGSETEQASVPVLSEGRRKPSWIWMAADRQTVDGDVQRGIQDAVRVEYLKTRARAQRCREQVALIVEEKRRVLVTLQYEAKRWEAFEIAPRQSDLAHAQGLAAYAASQADTRQRLAEHFARVWSCALPVSDQDAPAPDIMNGATPLPERDGVPYVMPDSEDEMDADEDSDMDE